MHLLNGSCARHLAAYYTKRVQNPIRGASGTSQGFETFHRDEMKSKEEPAGTTPAFQRFIGSETGRPRGVEKPLTKAPDLHPLVRTQARRSTTNSPSTFQLRYDVGRSPFHSFARTLRKSRLC